MNDQKNKQQQPQQGNKQNQPGQQNPPGQQSSSKQSATGQGNNMKNKSHGGDISEGDIEHPDQQPDKKVTIDDNPDETQRKVPNMQNRH